MKHCKYWDYTGIDHLSSGAGFLPSTVSIIICVDVGLWSCEKITQIGYHQQCTATFKWIENLDTWKLLGKNLGLLYDFNNLTSSAMADSSDFRTIVYSDIVLTSLYFEKSLWWSSLLEISWAVYRWCFLNVNVHVSALLLKLRVFQRVPRSQPCSWLWRGHQVGCQSQPRQKNRAI